MYIIYHFMAKRWEYNGNSDRLYYSLHTAHTVLPPPSPCPKVYSLCLCLHYCPENRFISIIFLDSTYMHSVSSVTQLSPTLCDSMGCSTPGFPVHHQLPELAQTHVHRVGDAIKPSHPLSSPFSSCPQSFPASRSFQMSQLFASGGQSLVYTKIYFKNMNK